jgi:hypothetical protein
MDGAPKILMSERVTYIYTCDNVVVVVVVVSRIAWCSMLAHASCVVANVVAWQRPMTNAPVSA